MTEVYDTGMFLPTGPQDCGAFYLDAIGPYEQSQVSVRWWPSERPSHPDVEQAIESAWQRRVSESQTSGALLHDGLLCRLISYEQQDNNQLVLTLGQTSYRAFVGTNLYNSHLRYLYGPETLANPLGVSALVLTTDGYLIVARRSKLVAYHVDRVHPVGGCVEPAANHDENPDPFVAIAAEISQELGMPSRAITELTCLGLIRDKHIVQPELLFDARLSATADAVRASMAEASEAHEHVELVILRDHPVSTVTFIESHYSLLTPVCLASLLLHGLHAWGSGWFASTRGYLRSLI